ncbi:hypothetical protein ALT1000_390029 [Alteromonas macleodii]
MRASQTQARLPKSFGSYVNYLFTIKSIVGIYWRACEKMTYSISHWQ